MSQITRSDAEALIPVQEIDGIMDGTVKNSIVLSKFRRLPNMTSDKSRMKILDALPLAYFQTADTSLKKTTKMAWANKFIVAEEVAVIVPIPESVLDDAEYDIWGEVRPRVIEAFGKVIDKAILTGEGKPANWRMDLLHSINDVGAVITPGNGDDLYKQVSDAMGKVEDSGYNVNGIIGGVGLKKAFRDLRDTTGNPLSSDNEVSSLPRGFVDNGSWDNALAKLIVGDFSQAVFAIRKDITYKLLTEGVIQDTDGTILYNLAQQDMVALRFVMRLGWELPNPVNATNESDTRFPFAAVKGTGSISAVNAVIKVTNDGSNGVISGARVTLGGNSKTTGNDGLATFKVVSGQEYDYCVFADGYKSLAESLTGAAATTTVKLVANSKANKGKNPAIVARDEAEENNG